jgi:UDP-N-acetylmuramyl pentapeptide phosphotransferase/UDP-N-acetylglucosamine-1-phosphate transferase
VLHPAVATAASCAAVALGVFCNRRLVGWLPDDPPRPGRKEHGRPVPLAGVLLLPAIAPWLVAAAAWWLLAGAALAAVTGFVDDHGKERGRDLDWRRKAFGLAVASAWAAVAVAPPQLDAWTWLGVTAFVFVLANATNFLDNADGVAASLSATSLLVLAAGEPLAAAAGFAALGFLPWNWPRAHVFLGDAGAYLLGICTGTFAAAAALREPSHLLAVAVQLADFAQVVAMRVLLGLPPWVGDRRHLTHIAQNIGVPRIALAPLFAAIALALASLA